MKTEESLTKTNGGFWTGKDTPMREYGMDWVPEWFVLARTIDALVERKLLIVWNSRVGKYGVYPYEVKLSPDFEEKIKLYKF
jgi:hypothetical protein